MILILISIGHLYLSRMWVGVAPRTHTQKNMYFLFKEIKLRPQTMQPFYNHYYHSEQRWGTYMTISRA